MWIFPQYMDFITMCTEEKIPNIGSTLLYLVEKDSRGVMYRVNFTSISTVEWKKVKRSLEVIYMLWWGRQVKAIDQLLVFVKSVSGEITRAKRSSIPYRPFPFLTPNWPTMLCLSSRAKKLLEEKLQALAAPSRVHRLW
jgi:hypothetical protein